MSRDSLDRKTPQVKVEGQNAATEASHCCFSYTIPSPSGYAAEALERHTSSISQSDVCHLGLPRLSISSATSSLDNSSLNSGTVSSSTTSPASPEPGRESTESGAAIVKDVYGNTFVEEDLTNHKTSREGVDGESRDQIGIRTTETNPQSDSCTPVKRGRGRPRKHPLPPPGAIPKVIKGRSKTGCLTCRRRKKKCGEEKPECTNCHKNGLVCEGYPQKVVWQGIGDKLYDSQRQVRASNVQVVADLPVLIDGVVTDMDRRFLHHFIDRVSRVMAHAYDDVNPFRELLLPLAMEHKGLMHSLLCLAGSHLNRLESGRDSGVRITQGYHYGEALKLLKDGIGSSHTQKDGSCLVEDHTVAMTIVFCLHSVCEGETNGQYQWHLDATRSLLSASACVNPRNEAFARFLYEFFTFQDVLNGVTSMHRRPLMIAENYILPAFILQGGAGTLIGVLDGLFTNISRITKLRDTMRQRKADRRSPLVDYETLSLAVTIDSEIRFWNNPHPRDTIPYIAAQLYRQVTWLYLYRTLHPSTNYSEKIHSAVGTGLEYLRALPKSDNKQSILLMPLFLLGCAAFDPAQRPELSQAFQSLTEYSNLGNIVPARQAVETVWKLMDQQDERSWDWEQTIFEMGYDFLVT